MTLEVWYCPFRGYVLFPQQLQLASVYNYCMVWCVTVSVVSWGWVTFLSCHVPWNHTCARWFANIGHAQQLSDNKHSNCQVTYALHVKHIFNKFHSFTEIYNKAVCNPCSWYSDINGLSNTCIPYAKSKHIHVCMQLRFIQTDYVLIFCHLNVLVLILLILTSFQHVII